MFFSKLDHEEEVHRAEPEEAFVDNVNASGALKVINIRAIQIFN